MIAANDMLAYLVTALDRIESEANCEEVDPDDCRETIIRIAREAIDKAKGRTTPESHRCLIEPSAPWPRTSLEPRACEHEDGPGEEDGPWAEGWHERAGLPPEPLLSRCLEALQELFSVQVDRRDGYVGYGSRWDKYNVSVVETGELIADVRAALTKEEVRS